MHNATQRFYVFSVVLSFKDNNQRLLIGELVAGPGFDLEGGGLKFVSWEGWGGYRKTQNVITVEV